MSFTLDTTTETFTGGSLEEEVAARVQTLRDNDVGPGTLAALAAPIAADTVLALLALRRTGAKIALLHPRWSETEVGDALDRLRPDVIVGDKAWKRAQQRSGDRAPGADYLVFTSGTEGRPKIVMLTHEGFERHARAVAARLPASVADRWLLSLTPAHVGGLAMIFRAQTLGAALVVPPADLPHDLDPLVKASRITHLSLVPTQLARWLDRRKPTPPPPGLRCVLVGGASCPSDLEERARRDGWPIRVTYGLTETSSQACTQTESSPIGSVGPALDATDVTVDAPLGHVGPIRVRGPGVFKGYFGDLDLTREVLQDGRFMTPDLGRIDTSGQLWVVGRKDDVVITGGENVDPAEVEAVLRSHPDVADACVVGVPDASWGQRVVAAIVAREGADVQSEALLAWCRQRLAGYKVPKTIQRWSALPVTAGGKRSRAQVRARWGERTTPM